MHCYAETLMDTRWGKVKWGNGNPRQRTSEANWKGPIKWNRIGCGDCDSCCAGQRCSIVAHDRVFCASLADWLDDEVPSEWLADLLGVIEATPNLDWLLLTKRPQNWEDRIAAASEHMHPEGNLASEWLTGDTERAPRNVWIGTTVEDQKRADERIPRLLDIPARVRFLSMEPLLESVDLGYQIPEGIHWVICGGESGAGCRDMHPRWAEDLRAQCQRTGAAFFMKQMGGNPDKRHELAQMPEELRVRDFPVSA